MTTFGWDTSNYDDPPTVRDGIDLLTHKIGEGHHFYRDVEYQQSLEQARALGIPILGAYFVNHPGDQTDQVDWFVQMLNQYTPWWRTHPCFVLQIDAEKFDYMSRAPTFDEIQAFGDRLVSVHGVDPARVLAYAPQWLYGNSLVGLRYRLWASAYGGNPIGHYRAVYPGDGDGKRWQSYSGQTPLLLQYGSNATIGNQTTCDANAYRGDLVSLLQTLGTSTEVIEMARLVKFDDGSTWVTDDEWTVCSRIPDKLVGERKFWREKAKLPPDQYVMDEIDPSKVKIFPVDYRGMFGGDQTTQTGGGGGGLTPTQVQLIVRTELDNTRLTKSS